MISIHAPHEGERLDLAVVARAEDKISIHAPHEGERPALPSAPADTTGYFNPRSPRGGATKTLLHLMAQRLLFQSTLPTRGSDFDRLIAMHTHSRISIHAPHEGERPSPVDAYCSIDIFQSTLPTRGSD